jgi:hypothetical protein
MVLLQPTSIEIQAKDLADWLVQQGADIYWTVDGDPLLAGRLSLPCPGDELAEELRKVGRPLSVFYPVAATCASDTKSARPKLDDLVETEELGTRVLQLQWKDADPIWLLIEDKETSASMSRETSLK